MFVDEAKIYIKAGDGGDGAISFHREKYIASGGPDGGDGGKGGDIVLLVDDNLSTLVDFRFRRKFVADKGKNGSSKQSTGRGSDDLIIRVPRGTLVKDAKTDRLIADLSDDVPVIIARGGKGGKGNMNFATPTRQIPRFAKPGYPGDEFNLKLELKLLADVGLVGFPNVGKSTLVSVVSAARPKIANYHFTTLSPVLGVVRIDEGKSFVMADIPGLIEGASDGIGLGHEFLRHIERCRLIVHIVDISGVEGRNPIEDFKIINAELENFSEGLSKAPQVVAGNKCDMATPKQIEEFKEYILSQGMKFFPMSAATTQGTKELILEISQMLEALPPIKMYDVEPMSIAELEEKLDTHKYDIQIIDNVYIINAPWLGAILKNVDMDDYESLQYFQRVLRSSGIIDKLEEMAIEEGDTVSIFDFEFEYMR